MYFLYLLYPLIFGIDDAFAAVIIGGIVSALAGTASTIFNRKAQKDANAANIHIAQMNNEANAANVDKMNEYNSPASQVARLSAAGLNPNLVYGNGQVMNTQDSPVTYTAPQVSPAGFDFSAIGDAGNSMIDNFLKFRATDISQQNANTNTENAATNKANASTNAKNASTNAKNADTHAEEVRREQDRRDKEFQVMSMNSEAQRSVLEKKVEALSLDVQERQTFLKYYDDMCKYQLDLARLGPSKMRAEINKIEQDALTSGASAGMLDSLAEKYRTEVFDLMPETIKNLKKEGGLIDSNVELNEARVIEINKGLEKIDADIKYLSAKTGLTRQQAENYLFSKVYLTAINLASKAL